MQDNNISRNNLLDRMNSNEALNEEQRTNQSYENNIWYIPNLKEPKLKIIKIHMSLEQLDEILNLKIDKTSFISVFCIAFYINKIIKFKDKISLSTEEYNKLTEETKQQLLKYNFSTLQDRNLRLKQAQNDEEFQAILSRFDKDNITIVNSILSAFKYATCH